MDKFVLESADILKWTDWLESADILAMTCN